MGKRHFLHTTLRRACFFFFLTFVTENVNLSVYMLFNGYFRRCKDNTISNLPMCQCISSKGKIFLKKITISITRKFVISNSSSLNIHSVYRVIKCCIYLLSKRFSCSIRPLWMVHWRLSDFTDEEMRP